MRSATSLSTRVQGRRLLLQGLHGVHSVTHCLSLSRPLAQKTGKHDQDTRTTWEKAKELNAKAHTRMLMLAQGCPSSRLLLTLV